MQAVIIREASHSRTCIRFRVLGTLIVVPVSGCTCFRLQLVGKSSALKRYLEATSSAKKYSGTRETLNSEGINAHFWSKELSGAVRY